MYCDNYYFFSHFCDCERADKWIGQLLNLTLGPINILRWNVIWQQYSVTVNRYLKPLVHVSESPSHAGCSQLSKTNQGTQLRSCNSRGSLPMENPSASPLYFYRNLCGLLAVTKEDYMEQSWKGFGLGREKVHLHGAGSQPCSAVLQRGRSLLARCNFRSGRHPSSSHKLPLVKGRTGTLQL